MPKTLNIHEAKTHLSRLVEEVAGGDTEIIIARAGKPVARLVGLERKRAPKKLGRLKGVIRVPRDFNAPLSDAELAAFEQA